LLVHGRVLILGGGCRWSAVSFPSVLEAHPDEAADYSTDDCKTADNASSNGPYVRGFFGWFWGVSRGGRSGSRCA
jgi:hypothetical protein